MRLIGKQFLETQFYIARQMTWHLRNEGRLVNEKRIRGLMRLMDSCQSTIHQHQQGCEGPQGFYPYLQRGLRANRPAQVRCADITYVPMRRGSLYPVAIKDYHTSKVLGWLVSNMLEANFFVEALSETTYKFGPPNIMNADQCSQFASFCLDRSDRPYIPMYLEG